MEHLVYSDKVASMIEENNNNNAEDISSQKKSHKNKKKKWHKIELTSGFKKIKPPSFDGGNEEGEESWLLNVGKYFHFCNYSGNLRARLAVYQLNGKVVIWW
jgi:hypothetical protein